MHLGTEAPRSIRGRLIMERAAPAVAAFIASVLFTGGWETNAAPIVAAAPVIEVVRVPLPRQWHTSERDCLTRVIYHEARGESIRGMTAVGMTVMNRVRDSRYPSTICSVAHQKTGRQCQYTWACDKRIARARVDPVQWERCERVTDLILAEWVDDPTRGATHFHVKTLQNDWRKRYKTAGVIDNHVFYRR